MLFEAFRLRNIKKNEIVTSPVNFMLLCDFELFLIHVIAFGSLAFQWTTERYFTWHCHAVFHYVVFPSFYYLLRKYNTQINKHFIWVKKTSFNHLYTYINVKRTSRQYATGRHEKISTNSIENIREIEGERAIEWEKVRGLNWK